MGAFLSCSRSSFALAGYQLLLEGGCGLVGLSWKLPDVPYKLWACGPVSWKTSDLEMVRG